MRAETKRTIENLIRAAIADPVERDAALALLEKPIAADRPDNLLTGVEAARLCGVSRKTLRDWEVKKLISAKHITAKRVRFSRRELETFLCEKLEA